jgi:MFS family permease
LTPMMLGFIVSSTIGGQILSRTGRYKVLALAGFVVATAGMFLLSRMDVTTTDGVVVRNMAISGLGVGVMMSLFTIVVQNAFPFHQLGQVTASVQFFRSMGSTIGIAILGTVLTNQFQRELQADMPTTLKHTLPPGRLAALQNPQVLLAPGVEAKIKQGFAAFGPQGQVLFHQLMHAIRVSLAGAITDIFAVTTGLMLLALITTLFLREIPLRRSNAPGVPANGAAREREEAAR